MKTKHLLFLLSLNFIVFSCFSQARLIMNGDPYIVITNSAYLVLDNSNPNAISPLLGADGRIISEAEGNKVRWMVSNATGTYTVPFYENGEAVEIPVTVNITTGGTAGATNRIDFSTYDGVPMNSGYMPTGVTNMVNVTTPMADNSLQVTDRFWVLDANHATRPAVNVSFTYVDNENIAPNTLAEANLRAQRWNTTVADWDGFLFPPIGVANTVTNVVSGAIAPAADFFGAWTLVDFTTPLPIELLSNEVHCDNNNAVVTWSTASENNNSFFTIEKSIDGISFVTIGYIAGAGNSTSVLNYSFTDNNAYAGISYYRLKQTDYDGETLTFGVLTSENCSETNVSTTVNAFNDQTGNIAIIIDTDANSNYTATLFDALGKKIAVKDIKIAEGANTFKFDISSVNTGIYFISIENTKEKITKKILILN